MFVTEKEQPNRVGHHLKITAQRKFDILKFGQLSAQLKKGVGRREKLGFFFPAECCQLQWLPAACTFKKGIPLFFYHRDIFTPGGQSRLWG
jgi:hypothetical protein